VQYCVLKGYLRRVRDYRILVDESIYMTNNNNNNNNGNEQPNVANDANGVAKSKVGKTLRDLCDGTNDSDSLACSGYSKTKLDRFDRFQTCIYVFSFQFTFITNST